MKKQILLVPIFLSCAATLFAQKKNPNIVYILADDMGYGDISALNKDGKIPTPRLDRMVNNGLTFTDAHTSSAVSTPTRYGIVTGRYAFRTRLKSGVLVGHSPSLIEPGRTTVATLLKSKAYHTACIGKWHLGLDWSRKDASKPLFTGDEWNIENTSNVDYTGKVSGGPGDHGFDFSYIIPASLDIAPYVYIRNGYVTAPVNKKAKEWKGTQARGEWYRQGDVADDFDHRHTLQHLTDVAVNYIDSIHHSKEPFFMYLPLTAPHTPWIPSPGTSGTSQAGVYGDFVCLLDEMVGKILDELEKCNLTENTIVIFTSDNGSHWLPTDIETYGHRANYVYRGMKSDVWEGGHRVPFIVQWPARIKHARTSDDLVCTTDLLATLADLVGLKLKEDEGEDSYSFLSALLNKSYKKSKRTDVVYHSINGNFALRQGDFVFIDAKGSGGWSLTEKKAAAENLLSGQLYDLKNDVEEQNNLYESPLYQEKVKQMKALLERYKMQGYSR